MAETAALARPEEQFDDLAQQREAATLGMWVFLATEVMLFGALFLGYTVYRFTYPQAWAEASHHLFVSIATANTAVLLTSSLTMALAVHAAEEGRRRQVLLFLAVTGLLGAAFLGLKGVEYWLDVRDGTLPVAAFDPGTFRDPARAQLFLVFYWVMTSLHALHLMIAVGVVGVLGLAAWRAPAGAPRVRDSVEVGGLYWHFVDVVWIFLYPLLYQVK